MLLVSSGKKKLVQLINRVLDQIVAKGSKLANATQHRELVIGYTLGIVLSQNGKVAKLQHEGKQIHIRAFVQEGNVFGISCCTAETNKNEIDASKQLQTKGLHPWEGDFTSAVQRDTMVVGALATTKTKVQLHQEQCTTLPNILNGQLTE